MAYVKVSFCILLLLLTVSCTKQQGVTIIEIVDEDLQNAPMTAEERISILEGRIDLLSSELQTASVSTHEVRTRTGEKTNYVVLPKDLNGAPDLSSTVHRVIPRPGTKSAIAANASTTSRPTMANNRPKPAVAIASATVPSATLPSSTTALSLPPSSASPQTKTKKPDQATTPVVSPSLSLPPETIVATATVPVAGQTSLAKPKTVAKVATPAAKSNPNTKAATNTVKSSPNLDTGLESAYKNALNTALAGKFNAAISLFEKYLQNYPNSKYVPNAYYWIGECLYAQKKFPEALLKFKEVASIYPKHHKTADALLKAGMTYDLMGDTNNAALQYNALLGDFPKSNAAGIVKSWGYVQ